MPVSPEEKGGSHMRVPKTLILMSLVVVTFTIGRIAAESPQTGNNAPLLLNPKNESHGDTTNSRNTSPLHAREMGPKLRISIRASAPENTDSLRLHVTFENVSDKDTVLNLGMMLANGKVHLPDAIRLILTGPESQSRELHFSDKRYPVIAGRVDDYAVPLRAGSAYTLKLSLKDYWCPKSKEFTLELKPERYSVRAEFIGNGARHLNGDTEGLKFMHFWTGELRSDVAQFQIGK
jgi:hypothetical protein